jgi:hypothetical protein
MSSIRMKRMLGFSVSATAEEARASEARRGSKGNSFIGRWGLKFST